MDDEVDVEVVLPVFAMPEEDIGRGHSREVSRDLTPLLPLTDSVVARAEVYSYSLRTLLKLDPETQRLAQSQIAKDRRNAASAPLLMYESERVPMGHERALSVVSPGNVIALTTHSTVFTVKENPGLVLKYMSNCGATESVHPALRDFWFIRALRDLAVVPRSYFVSPPAKLELTATIKTDFRLSDDERFVCASATTSVVRYTVMAKTGVSMLDVMSRLEQETRSAVPSFRFSIEVLRSLIDSLHVIHDREIIHGDVHPGNIVFLDKHESVVGLIDFGMAMLAEEAARMPTSVREPLTNVHWLMSPFSIEGFRQAYRDDVFQAVQTAAILMNGFEYINFLESLVPTPEALHSFKQTEFLFTYPGGSDVIENLVGVTAGNKQEIRMALEHVLDLTRGVHWIEERPPYDIIWNELDEVLARLPL